MQGDKVLLLNNGLAPHHHHVRYQVNRHQAHPLPPSSPTRERLRHSQPMHIQAARCLKEELELRPASLPAIPSPFPELCSPTGSPVLSPILAPDTHIVKIWSEDGSGKVVEIPGHMTARDVCQLLVYKSHCVDDNAWTLVEHHPVLGLGKVYKHFFILNNFPNIILLFVRTVNNDLSLKTSSSLQQREHPLVAK
uniref:Ras-associating domain-containing protein n=1 Tax=Oryzias melastigma TaxID=30732 RepID=A0A3B3DL58_ORYME